MASLFISYSRRDKDAARKLTEAAQAQNLDSWIDWEAIHPTEDWWKSIEQGIEEADHFLFLMSPDSVKSEVCQRELGYAVKNGKRLIPVVVRDIRAEESPQELRHLNWIFIRETDDFDSAFRKLITAIKTDYAWVQSHRQLLVKALEWERNDHRTAFLLRGEELQEAEVQLATNSSKEPHPTDLQREYVLRSRQASDRQRRNVTGIAMGVVIALATLSIVAFIQAGAARSAEATAVSNASIAETERANAVTEANARATAQANAEANQRLADERARISRAGELAAQSSEMRERNFQISLLLGIEALGAWDTVRSREVLLEAGNANPQLIEFLTRHTDWVMSVTFSPDGKTIASGSRDGTIILWNMETRQPVGELLAEHTSSVSSIAFSPDGKTLASGRSDGTIILWNMKTRRPIGQPLTGDTYDVSSIAFSPDGKTLASGNMGYTIILRDVETRLPIGQPLRGHTSGVYRVAFSPDGKSLASGSYDNTIILWDVSTVLNTSMETRQPTGQRLKGHPGEISSIAFSPDGKTLASGSWEGTMFLWDVSAVLNTSVETQQPIAQRLTGHTGGVSSIAFSPDGKTLASGSMDHIILWDVETRQPIGQPLAGHIDWVASVAFSPDSKSLASGSWDNSIILWDVSNILNVSVETRQPIGQPLTDHRLDLYSLALSPDGKTLVVGSKDGTIILWNMETRQPIGQPLTGHTAGVYRVAFSPDGKTLAAGSRDGTIILWNMETRQPIGQPLTGHRDSVNSLAFSPDGKTIASTSYERTIILWDAETRQPIGQALQPLVEHTNGLSSVAFSPDGKTLASGGVDYSIILWDLETRQPIDQRLTGHTDSVSSIAFSPDGKTLASGSWDDTIILWDVEARRSIGQPLIGHTRGVSSVAFSPDGKTLASGSDDDTVILWDVETQQPIGQPLTGHTAGVLQVTFSSDGNTLASGGGDGIIILWNLNPQSWIEQSCQRVGRNFTRAEWQRYFPNVNYRKTCQQWPLERKATPTPSPEP